MSVGAPLFAFHSIAEILPPLSVEALGGAKRDVERQLAIPLSGTTPALTRQGRAISPPLQRETGQWSDSPGIGSR